MADFGLEQCPFCGEYGYFSKLPDLAKILRLCNEIEDMAAEIGRITMDDTVYAESRMIFDKVKEIGKELTGDAG